MKLKALYLFFGCRVNQVELQSIEEDLMKSGVQRASRDDIPDICIINTCSVTATAETKIRRKIRSLNRKFPEMKIYLIGCYVTRDPKGVLSFPGVVAAFPNLRKNEVVTEILASTGLDKWSPIFTSGGHSRACIKIQDGCPGQCTYCVVRCLRGKPVSRDKDEIVKEILELSNSGIAEVILTGINVASWGMDLGTDFSELLAAIANSKPSARVRISSIELAFLKDKVVDVFADNIGIFCPHLHIPLQSGSDPVLQHMKRNFTATSFLNKIEYVKNRVPLIGLTSDVIAGYPTETEKDFANTVSVCREAGFHRIHGFSYSPRPGTESYSLGDRINGDVKKKRVAELSSVANENLAKYVGSLSGKPLEVVFDGSKLPSCEREGYCGEYLRILSEPFVVPGTVKVTVLDYKVEPPNVIMSGNGIV